MNRLPHTPRTAMVLTIAAALLGSVVPAHADERSDLEQLRATTLGLIDALVDNGLLPREKAQQLMRDAEAKGNARAKANARLDESNARLAESNSRLVESRPVETGKDGKKVVRVSYVPEAMKTEIREQVKQEVLAQAKTERWGEPGALPDWLDRFQFEGDMRVRYESTMLGHNNTPSGSDYLTISNNSYLTRAADITGNSINGNLSNFNTQEDSNRWRLRARLGVNAKVSDMISAGLRITTGNTTTRTSTNQTLGQDFNKYSLVLDRGFIKLDPTEWMSASAGRIANPFLSATDLVWSEDLNFEGVAMTFKRHLSPSASAFLTAGWFPLSANNPLQTNASDLVGVQAGMDWKLGNNNRAKFGVALYQYSGIQGSQETSDTYSGGLPTVPNYATRYEYQAGFRQRGNTLFLVNAPDDSTGINWGLASGFRELNLTGSLDLANFDPVHVILTGDYVKNLDFNRSEMASRTGTDILDGKDIGYMARVQVGHPTTLRRGDWNVSLAYRYLGSDAVLDAFTNSDFGLGGTNNKGFILGANYGIDKNAWVTARWLSSNLIDSMAPQVPGVTATQTKLSVDMLQLDLNAKF